MTLFQQIVSPSLTVIISVTYDAQVLEGQNILVTISGKKNRIRVYYLSWLKGKILRTEGGEGERRNGYINVGELQV